MTAQCPSSLGKCPSCRTQIVDHHVLIQYETAAGTAVYAECPGCQAVISPE